MNPMRAIVTNPILRRVGHYIRFLDYYVIKKLEALGAITSEFYNNYSVGVFEQGMHSWSPDYLECRKWRL